MSFNLTKPHVNVANANDIVYIVGDDVTDGSIRVILDSLSGIATVETRADGVWNPGEFQLSQGSLFLGRDVKIASAGHHLIVETSDVDAEKTFVLGQEFDDTGSGFPEATIVSALDIRVIKQSDNSVSLTLTDHSSVVTSTLVLAEKIYIQTGSTGATSDVQIIVTEGVSPNDIVAFQQNFPSSTFPANSEIEMDVSPGIEFDPDRQIEVSFTSSTAFTMLYDTTSTFLWFASDEQQLDHEDLLTETLILTNDLSIVFTNEGELLRSNEVFT